MDGTVATSERSAVRAGLAPFEELVREHGEVVLRVCRAVVGPDDAEDAWSETFASALAAYPRLRPDSNVRGWLVTIAHRKAIDRYRTARRAPVPVAQLPEHPSGASEPTLADRELWGALATLPTKQRAAVAYHYVADLPYAEIAGLLGGTAAAARRSAADGIASLRKTFGETLGGTVGDGSSKPPDTTADEASSTAAPARASSKETR